MNHDDPRILKILTKLNTQELKITTLENQLSQLTAATEAKLTQLDSTDEDLQDQVHNIRVYMRSK